MPKYRPDESTTFLETIGNILWATEIRKNQCSGEWGELALFFFVYPYRFFIIASAVMFLFCGVKSLIMFFIIAFLYLEEWLFLNTIGKTNKYRRYKERQFDKMILKEKKKREQERIELLEKHKDDPPTLVKLIGATRNKL